MQVGFSNIFRSRSTMRWGVSTKGVVDMIQHFKLSRWIPVQTLLEQYFISEQMIGTHLRS